MPRHRWLESRGLAVVGRQLGPLPLRGDARRGPLPPRRFPAPVTGTTARRHASPVAACKSGRAVLLAPGILSPSKLAVKGAAYGRVPPLRSGQTLDCEFHGKIGSSREDGERPSIRGRVGHRALRRRLAK